MTRMGFLAGAVIAGVALAPVQSSAQSLAVSDSAIRAILVERIDREHQSFGIVVGIVEPSGRRIVSYGQFGTKDSRQVDGNTLFEIGSISKVFTSLLLADMVRRGEVTLDDPVQRFLPSGVAVPSRGGRQITLIDLATHSSGLPYMPTNFAPRDASNPYIDYTADRLYEFLSTAALPRDIGAQFEYSNLGGGLLGHALSRRAGIDYEALVRSRILDPLGMSSTRITVTSDMTARFATGHDVVLRPVPHWEFAVLAPAGAWRSTTNDLLTFLSANLGLAKSPLDSSMASMLRVRRPGAGQARMALGWIVATNGTNEYVLHGGTTAGFQTLIAFDPKRRLGVVVLSNAGTAVGIQDIAMHLLDPQLPLTHVAPPKEHKAIAVDSTVLERYAGRYELMPKVMLSITREGTHLYAQVTGQSRFELFAEADREFFATITDLQFTFEVDARGRAVAAIQHQLGVTQRWRRVD